MAGEKCAFEQTFSFSPLPSKKPSFLQDRDTLTLLMKWSMLGRISTQCYSFDQCFYPYSSEKFVQTTKQTSVSKLTLATPRPLRLSPRCCGPFSQEESGQQFCRQRKPSTQVFSLAGFGLPRPQTGGLSLELLSAPLPVRWSVVEGSEPEETLDPDVVSSLRRMEAGAWVPLDKPVVSVDVEQVLCTKVSMDLFDPIYSCGILRPSGHVVKCFHDVYPDYDELRQMLQEKDSEHYCVVGNEERGEFLFRLFKHLCFGGELCQYEDTIEPYISTTKQIYKDLISVQKDPETKKISVLSTVLKVCAYDESGLCYPGRQEEEQTFAYLIVDPLKRHVTVFYHCYGVGNFTL